MSAENIISLIASIIAVFTSIITIAISIWHQNLYDKRHRRAVPFVSLWDKKDNIFDRIIDSDAKIYIDIDSEIELIKKANFCVCIKILDEFKINNCVVKVFIDKELVVNKNVGTVTDRKSIIIPVFLQNEDYEKLYCIIDYYTEAEEHVFYEINTKSNFIDRQDEVYLLKGHIYKKKRLNILNNQLNLSYSAQEIVERLKEKRG